MPLDAAADPSETSDFGADERSPLRALLDGVERARKHTVWTLLALAAGTLAGWALRERLYGWLALPLTRALAERGEDTRLVFTSLTDPFILYFSVSLFFGVLVAAPLLMLQVFVALAPRLRPVRALSIFGFVLTATLLFAGGVAFCYFVLLRFAVGYLLAVGGDFETAITVREYLRFALRLLVALGVAAELPLITFSAARVGLVSARTLLRWFPYAVLGAFVLGAWLSPPDVVSQLLVAGPLLVLYLIGVAVAALFGR